MEPKSAGELDREVRIQRRLSVPDGYGNVTGDWADICQPRMAKMLPTRGGEQIIAARAQGKALWDGWVYFDPDSETISADDRLVDLMNPALTWNVTFAGDMSGRRVWLFLQLEQGGADG